MGKCDGNGEVQISSGRRRSGSSTFGLGLGEGLRAGQSPCGLGLGDALQLPKEDVAGAMRVLRTHEASAVRRMCDGAAPRPSRPFSQGPSGVVCFYVLCCRTRVTNIYHQVRICFLLRIVQQDALSEVTQFIYLAKPRVFMDGITALLMKRQGVGRDGER